MFRIINITLNIFVSCLNPGECKITEIEKCEGDASANNRKAKIIVFYEWDLKCKWKGKVFGVDQELTGTIRIPNLSDENDVDELDVSFISDDIVTYMFFDGIIS